MRTLLFWFGLVLIVGFSIWMVYKNPPATTIPLSKTESEGVVLYDSLSMNGGKGWIKNTNSFPVRIRQARLTGHMEITKSMDLLNPGVSCPVGYIDVWEEFYIYTKEGGLIGFISTFPPRKRN